MLRGFPRLVMRGNVIDLAVAVVIGTAFTALVTAISDALIQPLVNLLLGGGVDGGKLIVSGQVFDFSAVVNAIINFLIIAAVLYFVIVTPVKRVMELTSRGEAVEETPAPTDEAVLLAEIRDLLRDANTDRP